ncbi:antibiotic biosynthesis monooxygenase [Phenylobacterium sp.]|uniref:antibiotic biosynthesis monooxygenase family protein n=1 Tax=Phenylobacterium sp. TaxID=1871053 RepID=UPI0030F3A54D
MNRVAATPKPPYFAVTTTTQLSSAFDESAYFNLGARLYGKAHEIPGFLGLEAFFEGGASIAVSYWESLDAIERWRNHPLHGQAKSLAKSAWFGPTMTRIARVEADYGFNLESG